jgi:hypothetical protein
LLDSAPPRASCLAHAIVADASDPLAIMVNAQAARPQLKKIALM